MHSARPVIAANPRHFGRGMPRVFAESAPAPALSSDFKLFATTFAGGFLFVSILLA